MNKQTFAAIAMLCVTPFALAQSVTERNGMLADASGRTLYIFDKDGANQSNCYDGCAAVWPPFMVGEGAVAKDGFSIVTRKDGSKQWAYKSMPLYYYTPDTKPGDVLGDGKGGVWHIVSSAKPVAANTGSTYNYNY